MTNIPLARTICQSVEGFEIKDGLSTVCLALIHLAYTHGYSKEESLAALAGQWDLYEAKEENREKKGTLQ